MTMKRVLVVTNVASINTKTSASALGAGEIGVYGISATNLRTEKATTVAGTSEQIEIALGRGVGDNGVNKAPLRFGPIDLPVAQQSLLWSKAVYAAPVMLQQRVTTTCLGNGPHSNFILSIAYKFQNDDPGSMWQQQSIDVAGEYATATDLYAALAAKVNAAESLKGLVTASSSSGGLIITNAQTRIQVELGFNYADNPSSELCATCDDCASTITKLNEPSDGEGTWAHLKQHLLDAHGHLGAHWQGDRLIPNPGDEWAGISRTQNWDFYFLNYKNLHQPKGDHGLVFDVWQECVMAVPTGTNFDAVTQVISAQLGVALKTALI